MNFFKTKNDRKKFCESPPAFQGFFVNSLTKGLQKLAKILLIRFNEMIKPISFAINRN